MFLLGIIVGRGSSPVKFDTLKFQKRLETIASEFGEKKGIQKKIDLKFYDVLDHPVPEESVPPQKKPLEIIPKKEIIVTPDTVLLKTSRKKQTFKQAANKVKPDIKIRETSKTGEYTIQIAAYKNFKDAVSHMAMLEKKGFSSYRVKGQKEGVTWYRIRTGFFATHDEAKKNKEKLDKAGIKSMIIKRDKNEDING
ncbi:MAG: SPOR domain-containing protein [Desulfobacterales bacterium]|nr:SPOR domain-containing protein [Desulfobacterales bacterium]MBU8911394.1 SPOR domain-containing protein [Desulfobacterales bacterium]